ncbi:MAG: hypothetical protein U5P10_10750 [Spirochaetia bacterium]|nr:hypothetical protein [Spirochaetia bacterium]
MVTDCFVLAGRGRVIEYAGGYADWEDSELRRKTEEQQSSKDVPVKVGQKTLQASTEEKSAVQKRRAKKPKTEKPRTLSYKERQELENLPDTIINIEAELERIHNELADPELYRSAQGAPAVLTAQLKKVESELEAAYRRWEELQELEDTASS